VQRSIDTTGLAADETYRLLTGCVVPRPIALVSTVSADGVRNLAPFSFFNLVSTNPATVMVSVDLDEDGTEKDTCRNIRGTGEFVVNLVTDELAERMVRASLEWPASDDEFEHAGFTPVASALVAPPRVGDSPVSLECRSVATLEVGESTAFFGGVAMIHVDESVLLGDRVDPLRLDAVGRLAGVQYCRTREVREIAPGSTAT
jgi:flavin reductase (DIM6/NTAB) family NADH-FMN oxidoreductase RutF